MRIIRLMAMAGLGLSAGTAGAFTASAQGTVAGRISIQERPGEKTSDLGNTVIYLEPKAGPAKVAESKIQMAINGRNFAPRVRVVPVGSTVDFPNQDPFTHNVFSTTAGALFDLQSYGSGVSKSNQFKKAGSFAIYCNVHAKMTGHVVVVGTPWFTQAGNDGRWEIAKVPAGKYTMTVWHERTKPVTSEIDVPAAGLAALDPKLDATGFKDAPHLNKFGKAYAGVVY